MHVMKHEADASRTAKRKAMGLDGAPDPRTAGDGERAANGMQPPTQPRLGYKRGGAVVEGKSRTKRLDRPRKHGDAAEDKKQIASMIHKEERDEGHKPTKFARGGRAKAGKTNINIVIAQPKPGDAGQPMPVPVPAAPMPPAPRPMPPMPPGAVAPPGVAAGAPPLPMRKAGGRVAMDAGAGSGEGRLEKIKRYGKNAKLGAKGE